MGTRKLSAEGNLEEKLGRGGGMLKAGGLPAMDYHQLPIQVEYQYS